MVTYKHLDAKSPYHDVVERPPASVAMRADCCRNERGYGRPQGIAGLENARHFVRIGHVANPGTPGCVHDAVAESNEDVHDDKDRVRGVERYDEEGDKAEERCDHSDASLA